MDGWWIRFRSVRERHIYSLIQIVVMSRKGIRFEPPSLLWEIGMKFNFWIKIRQKIWHGKLEIHDMSKIQCWSLRKRKRDEGLTLFFRIDSWPESKSNISCSEMPFPEGISSAYYVGSFAHTRYKVTSYYPEWLFHYNFEENFNFSAQASMKTVIHQLDKLAFTKKNTTNLDFSFNFLIENEREREKEIFVTKPYTDR